MPSVLTMKEAPDLGALTAFGSVVRWEKTPRGVLLAGADGSETQVTVLAPDLLRVRAQGGRALAALDHSWSVAKREWAPAEFEIQETPESLVLRTPSVRLEIKKDPFVLRFIDETTGLPFSSDLSPMRYDAGRQRVALIKSLGFDEHFFGFGEKAFRLNRRRCQFTMWNSDTPGYTEGTDPLYQSIPFYLGLENGRGYGLFFDNSYRTRFDMGYSSEVAAVITADGGELDYYVFAGPALSSVIARYTELTGRMPLPPRWALGNQQSRWSYYPQERVEEVARRYREADLPLDAIHLDIDYMDGYRVFTWDKSRFPDPKGLTSRLAQEGVRVVTIIDPGVKHEPGCGNATFEEGRDGGYFLGRADGSPYVGKVWPGDSVFVDYTKEAARRWWGDKHRLLLESGVSGIWNDMNEPADFSDPDGAKQADVVSDDLGRHTLHGKNRNVFGLLMARSTFEGLSRLRPDERPFVLTRAGYAGIQRYAAVWTGDNVSSWDALRLSLPMFQSLGLSGVPFVGSDIGGFMNGDADGELMARWYQVGFLTPFCRNHRIRSGKDQEPFRYPAYYQSIFRKYLKLRYRWMPYLYGAMEEATRTGLPFFRPLVLDYQTDPNVLSLDDQFLVGRDLMAAPVLKEGQTSRPVYFPSGEWIAAESGDRYSGGGFTVVDAPLEEIPLFHRAGSIFPSVPAGRHVDDVPWSPVTLDLYPDRSGAAEGTLYEDDGKTLGHTRGEYRRTRFTLKGTDLGIETEGRYLTPDRSWVLRRHDKDGNISEYDFKDSRAAQMLSLR